MRRAPGPSGERGQSTAEFVLVLPVILLVLAGLVQVVVVARDEVLIWNAAREAGRQAAVGGDADSVRGAALGAAPGLDPSRLSVTVSGGGATGELVTVVLAYRSTKTIPLIPLSSALNHGASATYRFE